MCCSVVLRLGAEEGSATDEAGGGRRRAELDYMSLMRGDRRHSLPPPISTCIHTRHMHPFKPLLTLPRSLGSFYFIQISHLPRFKRQNPSLPQNITIQNCLAREQDRCIIQMTVKALYQSFMWISSSWLEKKGSGK